jgi:hypothetical protein
MERELRIKKLKQLQPTAEKKMIHFGGKRELFPVYEIPLELLIYNQYNGRIKAMTMSWENSKEPLNAENPEHVEIIEQFLWDSAPARNESTFQSIVEYGQMEIGMITQDGVIIDGNRRANILKRINREHPERNEAEFFRAVILPTESFETGSSKDKRREIVQLETIYQMGVDAKVDYNPIEKYLRLKELSDLEYSEAEMSKMLSITTGQVSKMLEIYGLMSKYLERYGYQGILIALEKREGHFVDLRGYEISYQRGVGKEYALWDYNQEDINSMINVYFDYTRSRFPVQNCRIISNPSKSQSLFCHKPLWDEFLYNHNQIISEIYEPKFSSLKDSIHDRKIQNILAERDDYWAKNVKPQMIENISTHKRRLEDIVKKDVPHKKLLSVNNTLGLIDENEVRGRKSVEINEICIEIGEKIDSIKSANFQVN